jgi:hypothetical protein
MLDFDKLDMHCYKNLLGIFLYIIEDENKRLNILIYSLIENIEICKKKNNEIENKKLEIYLIQKILMGIDNMHKWSRINIFC